MECTSLCRLADDRGAFIDRSLCKTAIVKAVLGRDECKMQIAVTVSVQLSMMFVRRYRRRRVSSGAVHAGSHMRDLNEPSRPISLPNNARD